MSDPAPWRRSQQAGDSFSPDVSDGGNGPPPPPPFAVPPPPPPPGPGGGIPSLRINSEIEGRGRSPRPTAPGEPPAAIQNAMMTKDKKPFTYTPGGLDLSQIRSPRIQRRINRNMADEGVGPLPAQQDHAPLPPAAQAAMQPNMPVQVLPPPPPPPPPSGGPSPSYAASSPAKFSAVPPPSYAPPLGGAQAAVSTQAVQQTAANLRPTTIPSVRREPQPEPGSLYIAPFSPAPSPALATSGPRSQLGSLYIPPVADAVDAASASPPPPPPQRHFSPLSPQTPQANLNKAPTPWMSSLQQQQQQACAPAPPAAVTQGGARIIPIQIEGRESPQPSNPHALYSPHASFSPQTPNSPQTPQTPQTPQEAHLSQWQREQKIRQQQRQQQLQQHQFQQPQSVPWRNAQQVQPSPPPAQPGERTIPIRLESSNGTAFPASPPASAAQRQPFSPVRQTGPTTPQQQYNSGSEWGAAQGPGQGAGPPIQSQSFRVLQKITDDSNGAIPHQQPGRMNEMNAAQLRKLQLNDDDRALMNKFKAQVDDEVYLHQEADPRYRGAAIPSRAFRMLQNMTGEDDESFSMPAPSRISPAVRAAQQAVQEGAASQAYVPPSEQTVQEPRKYTGGAIPSRSFRMLQAMTGSENCDPADTSDL